MGNRSLQLQLDFCNEEFVVAFFAAQVLEAEMSGEDDVTERSLTSAFQRIGGLSG